GGVVYGQVARDLDRGGLTVHDLGGRLLDARGGELCIRGGVGFQPLPANGIVTPRLIAGEGGQIYDEGVGLKLRRSTVHRELEFARDCIRPAYGTVGEWLIQELLLHVVGGFGLRGHNLKGPGARAAGCDRGGCTTGGGLTGNDRARGRGR